MWSWQYYPISKLYNQDHSCFLAFYFINKVLQFPEMTKKVITFPFTWNSHATKNPRNVDFIKNTVWQNIGLITLCNILGFYTIIILNRNDHYMLPRLQMFKIILLEMPIATNTFPHMPWLGINKTNDVLFLSECVKGIR